MKIHLFYRYMGVLKTFLEIDEEITVRDEKTFTDVLRLFREPYKYESRIDIEDGNGACYFIRRNSEDVQNGVFDVTYSPAWNIHNMPMKMTGKALKKKLTEELKAQLKAVE